MRSLSPIETIHKQINVIGIWNLNFEANLIN